jgi:hypothetical protein
MYIRDHKSVYSAADKILDSTQKSRSDYTVLSPLFVHFRVPRVNHIDCIKMGGVKGLMAHDYNYQ